MHAEIRPDKVVPVASTPPPEQKMTHDEKLARPKKPFRFELDPINCGSTGISYDTLEALAASHGVTEDRIVHQALLDFAIKEIPGFDPDAPFLSNEQLEFLRRRREELNNQVERDRNSPAVHDVLMGFMRGQGETDERTAEDPGPTNGGSA